MKIQIIIDNKSSWAVPYGEKLKNKLLIDGHSCSLIFDYNEIGKGEILFLFSCEKIYNKLYLNKHNLVVHESALPHGKGWSPLTWQVLEGKNKIPISLLEATEKVDAGDIYYQDYIYLQGGELLDEMKHLQGDKTIELVLRFVENYPYINACPQKGKETFYKKRKSIDSELDITKTIKEQFNLLRVVDNERYPAFFMMNGIKYRLNIFKNE